MENFFKDIIILHTCTKNYSHDVQFLIYGFWKKKMKKMSGDIIIFHMCTMNDNHMMYGS